MKKMVGLLLASFAALSMTFMSCSADVETPKPEIVDAQVVDAQGNVVTEIKVDSVSELPKLYVSSSKYDKLCVMYAECNGEDLDGVEISNPNDFKKRADLHIAMPSSDNGTYNITLYISVEGNKDYKKARAVSFTIIIGNASDVYYAPEITKQPTGSKVGDTLTVVATLKGNGTILYQWYNSNEAISGETSASYKVTEEGSYYVKVSNSESPDKATRSNTVSIGVPIEISTQPVGIKVENIATHTVALSAVASHKNGGKITAQWYCDDVSLSAPSTATGSITTTIIPREFGNYVCKFTDESGKSVLSDVAVVNEAPIVVTVGSMATEGYVGIKLAPTVTSNVPCTYTYQWHSVGGDSSIDDPIDGATDAEYTVTEDIFETNESFYRVYVKVTAKSTQTGMVKVQDSVTTKIVRAPVPVPEFTLQPTPATSNIYVGETVEFTVNATSTEGTITYQWYKDGKAVSGATSASFTASSDVAATCKYYVIATNTKGGEKAIAQSDTVTVKFDEKPVGDGKVNGGFDFN